MRSEVVSFGEPMKPASTTFANGRYELIRELGHGGMGQVFEVRIVATGGRAALKTLRSTLATDPDYLERFRREAIAIGTLEHPHLVRCFDFGVAEDGTAYLVMELVEGHSLFDEVEQNGPVDPELAIRIGAQMCAALEVAHAAGVVHRDLKPSNIVLTAGYDGGVVAKVIDFGVASIKSSGVYQRLTGSGEIMGTPNYMAPEQLDASRHVDARTDVYGVGATLFGILAGRPPYPGPTLAVVIEPLLKGERPKLSDLRPQLGALADVIERAMALRPAERYPDVASLRRALLEAQGTSLPVASPARRWPMVLGIALAFAAGVGLVIALSTPDERDLALQPVPLDPSPVAHQPEPPRMDVEPSPIAPPDTTMEAAEMSAESTSPDMERTAVRRAHMEARMHQAREARMQEAQGSWDDVVVQIGARGGAADPQALRLLALRRRDELAQCLRNQSARVRPLLLELDISYVGPASSVNGEIPYPESDCVFALLERPRGALEYDGSIFVRITPAGRE